MTGWLFKEGVLTATTQTLLWSVIFFIASAAASSGYLTVSELFPLEIRALAIAVFFAIAQAFGALGPTIFGALIGDQQHPDPTRLFYGYLFAAAMMVVAGIVTILLGVKAERASLEDLTPPLSAATERPGSPRRGPGGARAGRGAGDGRSPPGVRREGARDRAVGGRW